MTKLIRSPVEFLCLDPVAVPITPGERVSRQQWCFVAFLQSMGDMFAFVGSQYKIQVGERDFFIDLLLYRRQLRALVALELKIGEFEPEYIGKMQFYLSFLDDTVRLPEEQPSIGMIVCKIEGSADC